MYLVIQMTNADVLVTYIQSSFTVPDSQLQPLGIPGLRIKAME